MTKNCCDYGCCQSDNCPARATRPATGNGGNQIIDGRARPPRPIPTAAGHRFGFYACCISAGLVIGFAVGLYCTFSTKETTS